MRRLIALALLISPVLAAAQVPPSPFTKWIAGDSVRVSLHDGRKLQGSLLRATRDSLSLRRVAGSQSTDTVMAFSHVSLVEHGVRRHTAGSALTGMGLGVLAGSAFGALAAGISYLACGKDESCGLAMVVGGVGGLLVGSIRTTSEWDIAWRSDSVAP